MKIYSTHMQSSLQCLRQIDSFVQQQRILQLRELSLNCGWPSIRRLQWVFMMTVNHPFMKGAHNIVAVLLFEQMWKCSAVFVAKMEIDFVVNYHSERNDPQIIFQFQSIQKSHSWSSSARSSILSEYSAHKQNTGNGKINLRIAVRPTLAVTRRVKSFPP